MYQSRTKRSTRRFKLEKEAAALLDFGFSRCFYMESLLGILLAFSWGNHHFH